MPYIFASDRFYTNKLLVDCLQAKCDFRGKTAVLRLGQRMMIILGLLEGAYGTSY